MTSLKASSPPACAVWTMLLDGMMISPTAEGAPQASLSLRLPSHTAKRSPSALGKGDVSRPGLQIATDAVADRDDQHGFVRGASRPKQHSQPHPIARKHSMKALAAGSAGNRHLGG